MAKKKKKPEKRLRLKLYGPNQLNDKLCIALFWNNFIGFSFRIMGLGFTIEFKFKEAFDKYAKYEAVNNA